MNVRYTSFFKRVKAWYLSHKIVSKIAALLLPAIIGWFIGWVMPSKPVFASNIPKKEMTCVLNYSQRLIQKRTSNDRLQITYDGKAVDDPHVFSISIQNTGNLAISNEDFKQEFVISFHDCGAILSAQVSKSSNQHVTEEIILNSRIDGEALVISDFFLNPNESFSVSVITNKAPSDIKYDARISDVSSLILRNTPKEKRDSFRRVMITFIIIVVAAFVAFSVIEYLSYKRFKKRLELEFMNNNTTSSK